MADSSRSARNHPVGSTLGALLVVAVLLAACSSDPDGSLTRVREAGRIRFAMSDDYPPFSFPSRDGELEGFDVDLSRAVAERLDLTADIVVKPWGTIIEALLEGHVDCILGSMAITPERQERVAFSVPYYHSVVQVMVPLASPVETRAGLQGSIFGLPAGSNYESDARSLGASKLRRYESGREALYALHREEIDATIVDQVVGVNAVRLAGLKVRFLGPPLHSEQVGIAFRPADVSLRERVDDILAELRDDGTLRRLGRRIALCEYDCQNAFSPSPR